MKLFIKEKNKYMIFKKPQNLKYTDLCIYIDQNVPKIVTPGENPEIENTVYNYLWHRKHTCRNLETL